MCSTMAHAQLALPRLQTSNSPCLSTPRQLAPQASYSAQIRSRVLARTGHFPVSAPGSSSRESSSVRSTRFGSGSQAGSLTAVQRTRRQFVASWEGRGHLGGGELQRLLSTALYGREGRGSPGRGVVLASLLGVGAPEALVIAVVALLVFGPKGLAEVARNLGKTLRAFQPTIKELQQVSQEFRSTLEQEIGLDELRQQQPYKPPPPTPPPGSAPDPTTTPAPTSPIAATTATSSSPTATAAPATEGAPQAQGGAAQAAPRAYTTEEYLRITEEQMKAMVPEDARKAAEAAAWGGTPPAQKANTEVAPSPASPAAEAKGPEASSAPKAPQEAPKPGGSSSQPS